MTAVRYLGPSPGRVSGYALAAAALAVAVISPHLGRAEPMGTYRPDLPAPALENGCFPLPSGLRLDFPYQVRSDGDVPTAAGVRRRLVLQYDELGAAQVRDRLDRALAAAHLPAASAVVTPIPGVADDAVVRGTVVLSLPRATAPVGRPATADQVCSDPAATKRFSTTGDAP